MGNLILSFMHRKICDQVFFFRGGGGEGNARKTDSCLLVLLLFRAPKKERLIAGYTLLLSQVLCHI